MWVWFVSWGEFKHPTPSVLVGYPQPTICKTITSIDKVIVRLFYGVNLDCKKIPKTRYKIYANFLKIEE